MTETSTLSALLTLGTSFLTWLITGMTSIISFITGNEYMEIGVVILLVSVVFGFLFRVVGKLGHNATR